MQDKSSRLFPGAARTVDSVLAVVVRWRSVGGCTEGQAGVDVMMSAESPGSASRDEYAPGPRGGVRSGGTGGRCERSLLSPYKRPRTSADGRGQLFGLGPVKCCATAEQANRCGSAHTRDSIKRLGVRIPSGATRKGSQYSLGAFSHARPEAPTSTRAAGAAGR